MIYFYSSWHSCSVMLWIPKKRQCAHGRSADVVWHLNGLEDFVSVITFTNTKTHTQKSEQISVYLPNDSS